MLRALTPDKSTHTCEYDFWDSQPRPRPRTFSPGRARAARRLHPRQRHAERAPHAGAVPPSRRSRARPPAHQLHRACGRSRSLWTGKETEAQRHEATCRDQQQGCAGARVFSTRLTPKCFKAWAFSRFLLCGS